MLGAVEGFRKRFDFGAPGNLYRIHPDERQLWKMVKDDTPCSPRLEINAKSETRKAAKRDVKGTTDT